MNLLLSHLQPGGPNHTWTRTPIASREGPPQARVPTSSEAYTRNMRGGTSNIRVKFMGRNISRAAEPAYVQTN